MDFLRRLRFLLLPLALFAAGTLDAIPAAAGAELTGEDGEVRLSLDGGHACPARIAPRPPGRAEVPVLALSAALFAFAAEPPEDAVAPALRAARPTRLLIHRFNE